GVVHPAERFAFLASRAARALPALLGLAGVVAVVQVVALVAIGGAVSAVSQGLTPTNERTGDLALLAIAVVALLPILAVGRLHDSSRPAVVKTEVRAWASLLFAWDALRAGPRRVVLAWAGPAAASTALVGAAAWVTGVLDVARPGGGRVAAVALVHQLSVLGL